MPVRDDTARNNRKRKLATIAASIFLIAGPLLLVAAIVVNILVTVWDSRLTESTTGTVVDVVTHEHERYDKGRKRIWYTYCGLIEYTVDGQRYTTEGACDSRRPNVGKSVQVQYDPNSPADAASGTPGVARWAFTAVLGFLGGIFTLIGGVNLWILRRKKTPPPQGMSSPGGPDQPRLEPRPFPRPNFPPARPGSAGYDVNAVNTLVWRIEKAYQQIAAAQPITLTAADFNGSSLAQAFAMGAGYDQPAVDMWLSGVRSELGV